MRLVGVQCHMALLSPGRCMLRARAPSQHPISRARYRVVLHPLFAHASGRWAGICWVAAEYRGGTFCSYVKKSAFSAPHRRLLAKSLFATKETVSSIIPAFSSGYLA